MFGIKGYIFIDGMKMPINNPPFAAITDYEKGHEYMQTTIDSLEKSLAEMLKEEIPPKCTGYMFVLVPEKKVE